MASKATDIAKNCGLSQVKRLERGVAYYVQITATLTEAQLQQLKGLVHDRMMEVVFSEFEQASALFRKAQPAPLSSVDIINGGRAASSESQY